MSVAAILALDIGTSSVRARLYGSDLQALTSREAVASYPWRVADGTMECDAEALFEQVVAVVDTAVLEAEARGYEIEGVCTAAFWHSLLGLDARGDAVTPVWGWGDSRARASIDSLRDRLPEEWYHRETGCFVHAVYPAAKLWWIRTTAPERFHAARQWVSFTDYMELRLFGRARTSISMASGTGLLDLTNSRWSADVLEVLGVGLDELPELVDTAPQRRLLERWAGRWRALAEVPWFPALGDGACANLGSGAVGARKVGLTIGTSAAIRVLWREAGGEEPPPGIWCYRLDGRHRVAGAALSNGGNGLAFLLGRLAGIDVDHLATALRNHPPDMHGLTVIPSLVPERSFARSAENSATISGLRLETDSLQIACAWLEATAQRLAGLLELVEAHFGPAGEVRTSGGALQVLPAWATTIADACGRSIRPSLDAEASTRGAAILAARELGWIGSLDDASDVAGDLVEPRREAYEIHRSARLRRDRLAEAIGGAAQPGSTVS